MTIVIVILHVIVCLFLIAVILLQAGRGQGLSWGVFGGTPQSILGTKAASFLGRVTTVCAILFLFTCIVLNIIETRKSASLIAPSKPVSQIDFAKIKEALEKAGKVQEGSETKPAAPVTSPAPSETTASPTTSPLVQIPSTSTSPEEQPVSTAEQKPAS